MARFAIVGTRGRLVMLESKKDADLNDAPYILRPGESPYARYRYCSGCRVFIATRRAFCPQCGKELRRHPIRRRTRQS